MANLFSKPSVPAISIPPPKPPARLVDEDEVKKAKARALLAQINRSGRQSTILSDDEEKLGG